MPTPGSTLKSPAVSPPRAGNLVSRNFRLLPVQFENYRLGLSEDEDIIAANSPRKQLIQGYKSGSVVRLVSLSIYYSVNVSVSLSFRLQCGFSFVLYFSPAFFL